MDCSADKDLFCSELKNTYSITVFRKWPLAAGGFINHRNTDPRYHSVHCVPFMNHLLSRVPYIIHFVPPCSVGKAFIPPLGVQCDPFINTFCSVHKMHIAGVSLVLQCKISSLCVPFIIYLFHRVPFITWSSSDHFGKYSPRLQQNRAKIDSRSRSDVWFWALPVSIFDRFSPVLESTFQKDLQNTRRSAPAYQHLRVHRQDPEAPVVHYCDPNEIN